MQARTSFPPLAANPNALQVRDNTIVRVVLAGYQGCGDHWSTHGPCDAQPGLETQQPAGGGYSHLCAQQLGQ